MFNSAEKFSNMFIFSINCFIVMNDVLLWELKLKQVGIIKSHVLYNLIIKQPMYFLIGKALKSFYSLEATLTLDQDYNGFLLNSFELYAQNIISQIIILINKTREIAYRSTEKKTLVNNATIKFKVGNLVRTCVFISFLSPVKGLYLNKVFFGQLKNSATGGKIRTKISLKCRVNPNSCAYQSGKAFLAFELSNHLTFSRNFSTSVDNKSVYINKSLTKNIKFQLNSKQ